MFHVGEIISSKVGEANAVATLGKSFEGAKAPRFFAGGDPPHYYPQIVVERGDVLVVILDLVQSC